MAELAAARSAGATILLGDAAAAFAAEARAAGVPIPQAAAVMLVDEEDGPGFVWLDDIEGRLAMRCGWSAPEGTVLGRLVKGARG